MTSVQRLVSDFGNVYLANIESDSNPGQLFDGVKQNVTILLAHRASIPRIYTTKLFRFFQDFREFIFPTLQFAHLDRSFPIQFGFAKAGSPLELSILSRMFSKAGLAMSRYPKDGNRNPLRPMISWSQRTRRSLNRPSRTTTPSAARCATGP
jgi:hypothetical protein